MRHILFGTSPASIAILIKGSSLDKRHLLNFYIQPSQLAVDKFIAFDLAYDNPTKCTVATAKKYLSELLSVLDQQNITTILCCDSIYFKLLIRKTNSEKEYGLINQCRIEGFEHINVILAPNYAAIKYNIIIESKLKMAVESLRTFIVGIYMPVGTDIIQHAEYPTRLIDIHAAFKKLLDYPELTCDIETQGLDFWNCGISTIAFAWNKHEGIAFPIDRFKDPVTRTSIRVFLKKFFISYGGNIIYHNAGFDIKVLIFNLFMESLSDYINMLTGLHVLIQNFDDTKIITYLATNNANQNILDLKTLALPFAGHYAEDVSDTSVIPLDKLLEYNLKDGLATWYVYETYYPQMVMDHQEELYINLMKPTVKTLIQMELCGMPIDPQKVLEAETVLSDIAKKSYNFFQSSVTIQTAHYLFLERKAEEKTMTAKKKVYVPEDSVIWCEFNPNSSDHLQYLLYTSLKLPILDMTKTKQPSTAMKTLIALKNRTTDKTILEILDNLVQLSEVSVLLSTFIPAFKKAQKLPNGEYRLYGNFNLGGTQSLRLSSSNPNLQNIPANSKFAKLIKACFVSTSNWLYGGSDFEGLEDKSNALLTRDPNKLKIFTDGFDGHCLRAQAYFTEDMPDIDPTSVASINSIKQKYPVQRQNSKAPTFALQYGGTKHTLVKNCGFTETRAVAIEARYHQLYKVADTWIADLVEKAKVRGWIPLAFGGRIRTPLIAQCKGVKKLTHAAQKEARSAGNAATQSYCFLTLRAINEFMKRVWRSKYRLSILPSGTIHDAGYFLVKNEVGAVKFLNDNLIECMAWQDTPELAHPIIRITASLELYYPSWAKAVEVPNNASLAQIKQICS